MKHYKATNKRIIPRGGGGRFRKVVMQDFGIGGTCPNCRHLLLQHYDGDERERPTDPRLFRYRCFTCEPRTEQELQLVAEIEAEKPRRRTLGQMLTEIAER
jgi:hypothetical protein